MAKTIQGKIGELDKLLTDNFDLRGSRQEHILFPQFYIERINELEKLLSEKFGIQGRAKAITIAVSYLIDEIAGAENDGEKS